MRVWATAIRCAFVRRSGSPSQVTSPKASSTKSTCLAGETRISGSGAEDAPPRELRRIPQRFLDPEQLVVLRHAVAAGRGAGLDLPAPGRDREVGDRRVLGLARAVRHD